MLDPKNFNYAWQFQRDFFGILYLRHLVTWFALVPILVVMFGSLPDTVRIPALHNNELVIHLTLPFKWWLLWISSFFYVTAWCLYILRSPRFIRRYANYAVYQSWQHSERWIIWEWNNFLKTDADPSDVDILIKKELATPTAQPLNLNEYVIVIDKGDALKAFEPIKEANETWFAFQRQGSFYRLGLGPSQANKDIKHSELFWELFGAQADSRPASRAAVWIILGLAAVTFGIVVLENIWAVASYLLCARLR